MVTNKGNEKNATHSERSQASQSTGGLLSSPPRPSLPPSQSTPNLVVDKGPRDHGQLHARATSSGDYFSQRPARTTGVYRASRISPLASVSGTSSDSSTRLRSPLAQEVQYRHNPDITFDSFLTPHDSDKGDAFRDVANAKKNTIPKMSLEVGPEVDPKAKEKTRRLSKMPSMSLLS